MADNLEIFGEEYTSATGIKAYDTNGNLLTFIKPNFQQKSVTPTDTQQIITADTNLGYNALSQVTVGASVKPSFTFKVLGGGTGTADYIEYNGEKRYETNSTIDVVAGDVVLVYNGGTPTIYYVNGTTVSVSSPYSFTMPYGNVSVLFERIYGTGYSTIQTSVLPEGEIIIDESGTYNVVNYASAQVTYPQSATGVSF